MTNRICIHLALIAGSLGSMSFASADVFLCEQAARFGFSDSLCEKPTNGLDNSGEQAQLNALARMGGDDPTDTRRKTFGQAKTHWQSEWSNRRDWEHVHGWNSFNAFYPFTGRFDHDWLQFTVPHANRRAGIPTPNANRRAGIPAPRPISKP